MNYFVAPGIFNVEVAIYERLICKHLNIEPAMLKYKSRKPAIVIGRQMVMYLIKLRRPTITLHKIGMVYRKDHATVLHSIKAINNIIETKDARYYPAIRETLKQLNHDG